MHGSLIRHGCALFAVLWVLSGWCPQPGYAFDLKEPLHLGLGVGVGSSYDPSPTIGFALVHAVAVYDYEQIMAHAAPEALRFKFEGSIGGTDHSKTRLLASGNIFAQYYVRGLAHGPFHPYVEGGIGLIYTDFQVKDQGLRLNFNPQVGIGTEWHTHQGTRWYTALRAWHVSNGGLHHDNRGINGAILQFGRLF